MEKEDIRKLVASLLTARNNARAARPDEFMPPSTGGQLKLQESGSYVVGMKGSTALNDATEVLVHDEVLGEKFSREALRHEIESILPAILDIKNLQQLQLDVTLLVKQMVQKLENVSLPQWIVLIPISGLDLQIRSLNVGNVDFINFANVQSSKYMQKKYFLSSKNSFISVIKDELNGKVLAIVKVNASDEERAETKGKNHIERALHILRLYLRVVPDNDPFFYRMYVGIEGTTLKHYSHAFVLCSTTNGRSSRRTGALFPFVVNSTSYKKMKKLSLNMLSAILKKDEKDRTEFENLLLSSIDYFGEGMNDLKPSNSFINFITCLESLLLSEKETIKGSLAERVALIVADEYENRMKYFEQMLRLYKLRSTLVHKGLNYLTEGDIRMLSLISFLVIRKMIFISKKINTSAELIDQIKRMKFSAPPFRTS